MNADEMRIVRDFEKSLESDTPVLVKWTSSHRFYSAAAVVIRANKASIRVRITETASSDHGEYPIGQEIVVPTFTDTKWSANNRAEPVGGY